MIRAVSLAARRRNASASSAAAVSATSTTRAADHPRAACSVPAPATESVRDSRCRNGDGLSCRSGGAWTSSSTSAGPVASTRPTFPPAVWTGTNKARLRGSCVLGRGRSLRAVIGSGAADPASAWMTAFCGDVIAAAGSIAAACTPDASAAVTATSTAAGAAGSTTWAIGAVVAVGIASATGVGSASCADSRAAGETTSAADEDPDAGGAPRAGNSDRGSTYPCASLVTRTPT
jgi:hypothetical protein